MFNRRPVVHANKSHRGKVNPSKDKRMFSHTADMAHTVNTRKSPMRGGYRL